MLEMPISGWNSIWEICEDDLYDEFGWDGGRLREGVRLRSQAEWSICHWTELVRPLHSNYRIYESRERSRKLAERVVENLGSVYGDKFSADVDVSMLSFWRGIAEYLDRNNVEAGDWDLVIEENILFCICQAAGADSEVEDQVRRCRVVANDLNYGWLVRYLDSVLC